MSSIAKHIRLAIDRVGLKMSDLDIYKSSGHYRIKIRGRGGMVTASASPKDPSITVLKVSRDLKNLINSPTPQLESN